MITNDEYFWRNYFYNQNVCVKKKVFRDKENEFLVRFVPPASAMVGVGGAGDVGNPDALPKKSSSVTVLIPLLLLLAG